MGCGGSSAKPPSSDAPPAAPRSESQGAGPPVSIQKHPSELIAASLFTNWDADKSGFLEVAEMIAVMTWFQQNAHVEFDAMFEALPSDKDDKDQSTGKIDAAEFVQWWQKVGPGLSEEDIVKLQTLIDSRLWATQLFLQWDSDSSGFLETDELMSVFGWYPRYMRPQTLDAMIHVTPHLEYHLASPPPSTALRTPTHVPAVYV